MMRTRVSREHIEHLAFTTGRKIEFTAIDAELRLGNITYYSELDPFTAEPLTPGIAS